MLKNLTLERPLAVLDLETTGTDPQVDRIVEVSVLRITPDGVVDHHTRRLNPGIPIPPDATMVHGITDADVAHEPPFERVAADLLEFLDGCDLCGFNIKRFDLRLLFAEFKRAGRVLPMDDRAIIDPLEIFHQYERRDLAAALRFYCGQEHEQAHSAAGDVLATVAVLDAMLARYDDLPRTVAGLYDYFRKPNTADWSGHFFRVDGQIVFTFGKYRGQRLNEIAHTKPDYLEWMLRDAFLEDTKTLVREALARAKAAAAPAGPDSPTLALRAEIEPVASPK